MARHSIINTFLTGIISILTCLLLTYSIFGAGLFVCTTPEATKSIGTSFADWDQAVFPEEDMAAIAEGVRSFSVDGTSSDALYDTIASVITKNYPALNALAKANDTSTAGAAAATALGAQGASSADGTVQTTLNASDLSALMNDPSSTAELAQQLGISDLSSLAERYTLPQNALQHLSDCTPLFQGGKASVIAAGILSIIGLVVLGLLRGRRRIGGTMMWAAVLAAALVVGLGVWAAVNFDSLFSAMHSVLFTQGNWMFDAQSLLIQLFPTAFWIAMAVLWAITDLAAALLVFIAGKIVK